MERHHAELKAVGLQVVAIGIGEPKHAERYCGKLAPSLPCLTDEEAESYGAYGLREFGLGVLVSPDFIKAGLRVAAAGIVPGQSTGNVKMLPGTFIIDQDGIVRYTYYSKHPGDEPPVETLIAEGKTLQSIR